MCTKCDVVYENSYLFTEFLIEILTFPTVLWTTTDNPPKAHNSRQATKHRHFQRSFDRFGTKNKYSKKLKLSSAEFHTGEFLLNFMEAMITKVD